MQNKLLPCPICDKEVSIALMGNEEFHYWWQITRGVNPKGNRNCRCRLFMQSEPFNDKDGGEEQKEDLIKNWNTRKPMERIVEQLEERENYLAVAMQESHKNGYKFSEEKAMNERVAIKYALEIVKGGVDNG